MAHIDAHESLNPRCVFALCAQVTMHPSSSIFLDKPKWVVYHELVLTSKEFMRCAVEISPDWLVEIAPHYYKPADVAADQKAKVPKGKGATADKFERK